MHETKNLELLNKIDYLEGSTKLYFKDANGKEYSIIVHDIMFDNNNVSPIMILCKMYNVDSIDKITFVRGCFIDNDLKNIGHIINDDWLLSIIQCMNKYYDYFKYIYESADIKKNNIIKNQNANNAFNNEKNNKKDDNYHIKAKTCDIIQKYERNIYHIYDDKIILQIIRQKVQKGHSKEIFIEFDKRLLDMLQTVEWRFALDSSSTKLYFVNGYYENQTNPGKYGGKRQVNMSDYCYGCKPGLVKYEQICDNYYKVKTTIEPLNKTEFEENLKKYFK